MRSNLSRIDFVIQKRPLWDTIILTTRQSTVSRMAIGNPSSNEKNSHLGVYRFLVGAIGEQY